MPISSVLIDDILSLSGFNELSDISRSAEERAISGRFLPHVDVNETLVHVTISNARVRIPDGRFIRPNPFINAFELYYSPQAQPT